MLITDYTKSFKQPLTKRTVSFLINKPQQLILLGMKKKGFGKGKLLGIGGKVEQNESVKQAAVREMIEEINVQPADLKRAATLNFYFPYVKQPHLWNQRVYAFIETQWTGHPTESEEIIPKWFHFSKIPFNKMWADASYWLPDILEGYNVTGSFLFDSNNAIEDVKMVREAHL